MAITSAEVADTILARREATGLLGEVAASATPAVAVVVVVTRKSRAPEANIPGKAGAGEAAVVVAAAPQRLMRLVVLVPTSSRAAHLVVTGDPDATPMPVAEDLVTEAEAVEEICRPRHLRESPVIAAMAATEAAEEVMDQATTRVVERRPWEEAEGAMVTEEVGRLGNQDLLGLAGPVAVVDVMT